MFGVHLFHKHEKQQKERRQEQSKERNWMKKYHSEIKPRLLQRYDTRVNAFIRQLEESPAEKAPTEQPLHQSARLQPFRFSTSPTALTKPALSSKQALHTSMADMGVRRASDYVPLSSYQFRRREKQKELPPKIQAKVLRYRKWQKQFQRAAIPTKKEDTQLSRHSAREFFRRIPQDSRSEIPSVDDNQSLRFSVNDNIQGEARQYQKQQELVERKAHFKRLANLQQIVQDPKAKKSIHELLLKAGFTKPKIRSEKEEMEVDMLKLQLEGPVRM